MFAQFPSKRSLIVLSFLALFSAATLFAQNAERPDPLKIFDEHKRWYTGTTEAWFNFFDIPESDIRSSIEHWEEIGKDLGTIDSSKKGRFGSGGDTHGSYLRWTLEKGFIWLHVDHCQGGPMRILRGSVEVVPDGIVLTPKLRLGQSSVHGAHAAHSRSLETFKFVAVRWMDAVYLVQKENLPDFADYSAGLGDYNGRFSYMFGNPYLAMGVADEKRSAGYVEPSYPKGYDRFHKSPVRGSIVSIGKGRREVDPDSDTHDRWTTPIKVNVQLSSKVNSSINLIPVGEDLENVDEFQLVSVKNGIATVNHIRLVAKPNCTPTSYEDCKDPGYLKLRRGLILSSNGL